VMLKDGTCEIPSLSNAPAGEVESLAEKDRFPTYRSRNIFVIFDRDY
jgi:hypothetical protein